MEKLTADKLKNLTYGQKVFRFENGNFRALRFVALMPNSENYLIFCDGEYLTHLYISPKDNTFRGEWYGGQYNPKFVGELMLADLEQRSKDIKEVYLISTDDCSGSMHSELP